MRLAPLLLLAAASRFAVPDARPPAFPRDHGSHDEARIEWWYVTGHLETESGGRLGYELTFFRTGVLDEPRGAARSAFSARDLHLAHFARTDVTGGTFRFAERAHRSGPGAAHAGEARLDVANEDWRLEQLGDALVLRARDGDEELSLLLTPRKPPVLHGEGGLSRKGPDPEAVSRYVSLTRLESAGWWRRGSAWQRVRGSSWFDHEWGPGVLSKGFSGWDWFALQLDDGRELMLYRLRGTEGISPYTSGTLVEKDGTGKPLASSDFTITETARWKSPKSGATYPSRWRVSVPKVALTVDVVPSVADQELVTERSTKVTYWEGACDVRSPEGVPLGRAYVEMTGYAGTGALGRLQP